MAGAGAGAGMGRRPYGDRQMRELHPLCTVALRKVPCRQSKGVREKTKERKGDCMKLITLEGTQKDLPSSQHCATWAGLQKK